MSYVDLHLHLLPGVDDGAADDAAALAHARRLAAEASATSPSLRTSTAIGRSRSPRSRSGWPDSRCCSQSTRSAFAYVPAANWTRATRASAATPSST